MPNNLQVDHVTAAMLAHGQDRIAALYGDDVDVAAIGDKDISDEGELIVLDTSVRIRLVSAEYAESRDNTKTTYNAGLVFMLLVCERNLRSREEERQDTLRLTAIVQDAFTGARLELANGGKTGPVEMLSVQPVMNDGGIVDQYYAVTVRVPGLVQFPGPTHVPAGEK